MINTLLGFKKTMTSSYDARGRRVGATVVEIPSNFVTQIKSQQKDGYEAVQLGMGTKKSVKKPQIGHAKKAGVDMALAHFKEVRIKPMRTASKNKLSETVQSSVDDVTLGQEISLGQVFFIGDSIKVTGVSKGKGFQGGVKRYNFAGGPKTHGQSDRHRAPGSIGSGTTPGRVLKGKRMAGHMGVEHVSYTGLEIIAIDKKNNLITVKGAVPGVIGSLVILEKQGRVKGYVAPPEEKPSDDESMEGKEEEESENTEKSEVSEPESESEENIQKEEKVEEVKEEEKKEGE